MIGILVFEANGHKKDTFLNILEPCVIMYFAMECILWPDKEIFQMVFKKEE